MNGINKDFISQTGKEKRSGITDLKNERHGNGRLHAFQPNLTTIHCF